MALKWLPILLIFLELCRSQIITSMSPQLIQLPTIQSCVSYQQGNCVSCPFNYHINQNQCFRNITNCITYSFNSTGLEVCDKCDASSLSDGNGKCSVASLQLTSVSSTSSDIQSVAQQYGDSRFQVISISMALADPNFVRCNNFMLNGVYSHFIARIPQPINAVSYFTLGNQNQYKILYYGSGGGLMMCIISSNPLIINSFVAIGTTNVIENCGLYNEALQCVACNTGYHLENNTCFLNIAGCISYYGYICLQCAGYAILIENRCIGCSEMGDVGKIIFFDGLYIFLNSNTLPFFSQPYLLGP